MKVAFVSGASGGIGRETVKKFIANEYFTIAQYNSDSKSMDSLYEELSKGGLSDYLFKVRCDFSDVKSVENALKEVDKNFKHIDVLVNNAGKDLYKLITDTTESEWDDIFSVNMKSAFMLSKYALKSMIERKSGKIINVSSIWGKVGGSMETAYSASKGAMISFTKALAKEVAESGINVNCICPGVIDTKMNNMFSAEEKAEIIERTPLKKMGTPKDIAELIYFLSSEKANFITGEIITCDGGFIL